MKTPKINNTFRKKANFFRAFSTLLFRFFGFLIWYSFWQFYENFVTEKYFRIKVKLKSNRTSNKSHLPQQLRFSSVHHFITTKISLEEEYKRLKMSNPVKKVPIHLQSAQNRIIIKNGTVVNDDSSEVMDVYIEDCR